MAFTLNDLTINPERVNLDALLHDWTWAMPEPLHPVLLTALGDVFAQGKSRAVFFIDTIEGSITKVAEEGAAFQSMLDDTQFVNDHFFPSRIAELRDAEIFLYPQQVYSHQKPLVLGGVDDIDNIEVTDVAVHISILGQIHQQVKEFPNGAPITDIIIE